MAEFDPQLLFEVLKRLQSDVSQLNARMDKIDGRLDRLEGRLTAIEDRMERMEKRQTAAQHFYQHVMVHLTSIDEKLDNVTAQLLGFDRRITALEAANAR